MSAFTRRGTPVPASRGFWSLAAPDTADQPCVITDEGEILSRKELQARVDAVRAALDGPGKKALVFILCRNDPASFAAYIACLQAGHAALLLSHDMEPSLLGRMTAAYLPEFIWSPRGEGHPGYRRSSGGLGMHRLYRRESSGRHAPLHPDLALLLSTSGSTGDPKLVRLSRGNLQANAASIRSYLELGPEERPVTSLPMHYSYGLSVINSHLLAGGTILLTGRKIRSPEFWDFFREHAGTSMAGVPYVYQMLREMGIERMDLPALRTLTQAGGHLDASLQDHFVKWCRSRGIRYYTMYGQTEATARIAYVPPERAEEGRGSIGVAIPGGKIELVDGELVYSGPNVMLGYALCREDLAKGDELGGRLFTGDMARMAPNGFCYITGRKKRFLKIMGLRINCDEVERQLGEEFRRKCVVVGDDARMTVVVEQPGGEQDMVDFIRRTYHVKGCFCAVRQVDAFPLLPTGKVDYGALGRWVADGDAQGRSLHLHAFPSPPEAAGERSRPSLLNSASLRPSAGAA